jgi:hypothetical protein
MGCRCSERREAIVLAASSVRRGDIHEAAAEARFVVTSAVQDIREAGRSLSRLAAARAGLRR